MRRSIVSRVLPGQQIPLSIMLGVVRWTKGKRFGVEFIRMHESQQRLFERYLTQLFCDSQSLGRPIRKLKSEEGGQSRPSF
jgi:hypothetical protein